jgi:hypothetical protein
MIRYFSSRAGLISTCVEDEKDTEDTKDIEDIANTPSLFALGFSLKIVRSYEAFAKEKKGSCGVPVHVVC